MFYSWLVVITDVFVNNQISVTITIIGVPFNNASNTNNANKCNHSNDCRKFNTFKY